MSSIDHAGETPPPPPGTLSLSQAEAMVRLIEAAPQVRRRYQYFVWMQSQLQVLLPHRVAVCGAYQRQQRTVVLEAFQAVPVPDDVLAAVTHADAPLVLAGVNRWVANRCRPCVLSLPLAPAPEPREAEAAVQRVAEFGLRHWLVHGVSRPQRPHELESLFLFATPGESITPSHLTCAELVMPHLHATYLRMQVTEREMTGMPVLAAESRPGSGAPITARERQILSWVREGMSNQRIAEVLGISALTVKNHVQKILRKLGASNRAQAVAMAMTLNLLPRGEDVQRDPSGRSA